MRPPILASYEAFTFPARIIRVSSLHSEISMSPGFNELVDVEGVCVADRERLLAITATLPQQEHESSNHTSEAVASWEKKLP